MLVLEVQQHFQASWMWNKKRIWGTAHVSSRTANDSSLLRRNNFNGGDWYGRIARTAKKLGDLPDVVGDRFRNTYWDRGGGCNILPDKAVCGLMPEQRASRVRALDTLARTRSAPAYRHSAFCTTCDFCGILGNLRMGSESEQGEGDVAVPLTSSDFQSEDFLKLFPSPYFPGEEELWNCGPQSSWGFFWKPESWAWSFRGMFETDFGVESCDPDFITKGEACARGRLRPPINPKKTALQRLVCRLFGFKPNGRRPTYERWLSPVFLLRHQTREGQCEAQSQAR